MKFKKPNEGGSFESCPEFTGRAVCVDVTPPETKDSQWGPRETFKLVFEVDLLREDGTPFCVWSKPFTSSLNEKANIRKFIRQWLGRDLTAQEIDSFCGSDTAFEEFCLGRPAFVIIQHSENEKDPDHPFANIIACTPDKGGDPLKPSGKFTRKKDRADDSGNKSGGSAYRGAEQVKDGDGNAAGRDDWEKTKVHVGKHAGVELGDLDVEAITKLAENWMPAVKAAAKQTADDKRLIAAIERAQQELASAQTGGDY